MNKVQYKMKENKTNCGVYLIINLVQNKITGIYKVYIGSSINLKSRKYAHFKDLRNNKHHCNHLQNVYNKIKEEYGEDRVGEFFKFVPIKYIEKIKNKEALKKLLLDNENTKLDEYKKEDGSIDHNKCYNSSPMAGNCLGVKHTEEFKQKCRDNHIGKKLTEETKKKMSASAKNKIVSKETKKKMGLCKSREVINLTTNEIFSSMKKAAETYSMDYKHISCVCRGIRITAGGYRWAYYKEDMDIPKLLGEINLRVQGFPNKIEPNLLKAQEKIKRKVVNLTENKKFDSITEAALFYNISCAGIVMACKGYRGTAGSFRWVYLE